MRNHVQLVTTKSDVNPKSLDFVSLMSYFIDSTNVFNQVLLYFARVFKIRGR